jgi:hypothetical protein
MIYALTFSLLWAVYILALSVGLWATSPSEWTWPQRVALSGGYLVLCTLLFVLSSLLPSVPWLRVLLPAPVIALTMLCLVVPTATFAV